MREDLQDWQKEILDGCKDTVTNLDLLSLLTISGNYKENNMSSKKTIIEQIDDYVNFLDKEGLSRGYFTITEEFAKEFTLYMGGDIFQHFGEGYFDTIRRGGKIINFYILGKNKELNKVVM